MARAPSTAVTRAKVALPANIAETLAAQAAAMASRIGSPSGDRIKITQSKRFRLPSGEESTGPLQAIIVDFVSFNALYDGPFDPNDITPPICAAIDREITSMSPFIDAPSVQHDSCSACPQNQYHSAARGNGKACQNSRLLAILPPDANAETPLMILKVSPTGLRSFDGYVASIARSFNMPPLAVVTEITIDPNLDYPSLRFGNPTPATPDQIALALSRSSEASTRLMTKPDFTAAAAPAPAKKPAASRRAR